MPFLKCGHRSISDTEPICAICPTHHWDPSIDPLTLPCKQWADPHDFPEGKGYRCVVCGEISSFPNMLPELHTDGNHIHYCGCRGKLFEDLLEKIE